MTYANSVPHSWALHCLQRQRMWRGPDLLQRRLQGERPHDLFVTAVGTKLKGTTMVHC